MSLLSVIVPCYNEEESVALFYRELTKNDPFFKEKEIELELLYIDDGSKDGTVREVKKLIEQDPRVHIISFSRNFGKEAAMFAGLEKSRGDYVVMMDVDLQDPPSLLPEMFEYIWQGYDSVATRRVTRKGEPPIRSFFARRFYGRASGEDITSQLPETATKDYNSMMDRAVRVTLAEAASLWLDDFLKKRMHCGSGRNVRIVKPAAGYASCPDHTLKKDILDILPESGKLGIRLTESFAMIPDASICGFIFFHPDATYPEIRHISKEQFDKYASRRGMTEQQARQFLGHLL